MTIKKKDQKSHKKLRPVKKVPELGKLPSDSSSAAASSASSVSQEVCEGSVSETEKKPKRIAQGAVRLQFAGELIIVKCPDPAFSSLFRRYQMLFESLANMERSSRLIVYKMLNALMLTSYAKKTLDKAQKKNLFDYKNRLFLDLANDPVTRQKINFRYLISPNFRVNKFCDECEKKNTETGLERREWKYCPSCVVDHEFYNILSMRHKFKGGQATIFLSNDLIKSISHFPQVQRGKIDECKEELRYQQYHYNVQNLDVFELQAIMKMNELFLGRK